MHGFSELLIFHKFSNLLLFFHTTSARYIVVLYVTVFFERSLFLLEQFITESDVIIMSYLIIFIFYLILNSSAMERMEEML